jgi:hypothetical protein
MGTHVINPSLNIELWKPEYSEEIEMLWDSLQTLMSDVMVVRGNMQTPKMINHTCTFEDFVTFCHSEHTVHAHRSATLDIEEKLFHIWRNLRRIMNNHGLHDKIMRGASFYHFCKFI